MRTIEEYLKLLETRLDILNCLVIRDGKIIPNTEVLSTNKIINELHLDDLFSYYRGKLIFKNRFLSLVGEITNRELLVGHYSLEVRS